MSNVQVSNHSLIHKCCLLKSTWFLTSWTACTSLSLPQALASIEYPMCDVRDSNHSLVHRCWRLESTICPTFETATPLINNGCRLESNIRDSNPSLVHRCWYPANTHRSTSKTATPFSSTSTAILRVPVVRLLSETATLVSVLSYRCNVPSTLNKCLASSPLSPLSINKLLLSVISINCTR